MKKARLKLIALSVIVGVSLIITQAFYTSSQPKLFSTQMNQATTPNLQLIDIQRVTAEDDFINPVWSPADSDTLAFLSPGSPGTFTLSLSSRSMAKVSDELAGFKFIWTEDGESIVYRSLAGNRMAIKQIEIETGKVSTLARGDDLSLPQEVKAGIVQYRDRQTYKTRTISNAPSITSAVQDTAPFAYQANDNIFIVIAGVTRKITADDGQYFLPKISPDSSKVLYQELSGGLYVTDIQSGETIHLGKGDDADWSPDSQFIIFEVTTDDGKLLVTSDLYVADLTGRKVQLTDTPSLLEMRPSWSPDGRRIAFDANGSIYIAEIARR